MRSMETLRMLGYLSLYLARSVDDQTSIDSCGVVSLSPSLAAYFYRDYPTLPFIEIGQLSVTGKSMNTPVTKYWLIHSLLAAVLSSAGNLCKQLGPRSGPTKCWS